MKRTTSEPDTEADVLPTGSNHKQHRAAVQRFLTALGEKRRSFKWTGTRSSDVIRVRAFYHGLELTLRHVVPDGHTDYLFPRSGVRGVGSGAHDELVQITVVDSLRRWGRVNAVSESFSVDSSLFPQALKVFRDIAQDATFLDAERVQRIGYVRTVCAVGRLIREMA